ncbi:MAG: type II toxin-antitoxin system VapC family toxin [Gaiellaceae bacterium]
MTQVVLDASVVLKWFRTNGERHGDRARALRVIFEQGRLAVLAPPLLRLEIVNVARRRWRWGESALVELAVALDELGFEFEEPELPRVASWTARGLTAYDAVYVALAETRTTPLITDDDFVVAVAGDIATALAATEG